MDFLIKIDQISLAVAACQLHVGNLSAVLVRLKSLTGRAHQTTYKMVAVANEAKNRGDDCEITYNMPIGL